MFLRNGVFIMAKFYSPLNNLKVASPCSQDWEAMAGDNRRRYCGECRLNVYNLSGMSRDEAENLIQNAEGRLCVRFYQRADGSVLTENCPVGWALVKQRTKTYVTALASLVLSFFGALGLVSSVKLKDQQLMGTIAVATPKRTPTPKTTPTPDERPLMGEIAVPIKENKPALMGKIAPPKYNR
jgi:hypothetical protein